MEAVSAISIGQRIAYKGDMANASGEGVVAAVRNLGAQSGRMFSINWSSGGMDPVDDSKSFDVVLDDGRKFAGVYVSNIGGEFANKSCRFMLLPGVVSSERIAKLQAGVAVKVAQDQAKADEKAAAFAAAKEVAKAAGLALDLVPAAEFKGRGSAAAANLRKELKASGLVCSVKQDGYDCIRVSFRSDGDNSAELVKVAKAIADKYEAGSFDGMNDMYVYSAGAWGAVFGDVRYVFVSCSGRIF